MKPSCSFFRFATFAVVLATALFAVGCSGTHGLLSSPFEPTNFNKTIAQGVTIDGVLVGGLTASEASSAVKTAIASNYGKVSICLHDSGGGGSFHYKLSNFGGYFDVNLAIAQAELSPANTSVPLPLKLNRQLVAEHLARVAAIWREPVQEPRVKFTPTGRTVLAGHAGRSLDTSKSLVTILANLPTLTQPAVTDNLPFVVSQPIVQPNSVLGLADKLVSYTTTFNPANATRTNNLLLAVRNINGTVVGSGEIFSYNDSVGPRTSQTGFQDAIIYVNNRMKKDVGGGICQASSTLYNCVLLANMPIIERHAHSLPVHYVPPGRDATVAWGGDDFRFENNTAKPIIIRAIATPGGTLTESLIGDKRALPHPKEQVAITVSPQVPYEDGFAVNSYRIVKENGVLIAREPLGISVYHKLVGGVPH